MLKAPTLSVNDDCILCVIINAGAVHIVSEFIMGIFDCFSEEEVVPQKKRRGGQTPAPERK